MGRSALAALRSLIAPLLQRLRGAFQDEFVASATSVGYIFGLRRSREARARTEVGKGESLALTAVSRERRGETHDAVGSISG